MIDDIIRTEHIDNFRAVKNAENEAEILIILKTKQFRSFWQNFFLNKTSHYTLQGATQEHIHCAIQFCKKDK